MYNKEENKKYLSNFKDAFSNILQLKNILLNMLESYEFKTIIKNSKKKEFQEYAYFFFMMYDILNVIQENSTNFEEKYVFKYYLQINSVFEGFNAILNKITEDSEQVFIMEALHTCFEEITNKFLQIKTIILPEK